MEKKKKKKKHQYACSCDGLWNIDFSLGTKKGLCSQYFPLSSDRAATFLSTPSKVTAGSASTCQMYACFVTQRVFVAFAAFIESPLFFSSNGKKL